jgi:phosphoribosylformylglycinamidine cyclo-ligase
VDIHYTVNITGHGWRKLMRAPGKFSYIIDRLPRQLPIFDFIQEHGPVSDKEAYGNLNMGAGFAFYVKESDVLDVIQIAINMGFIDIIRAGYIEKSETKKVIIEPKGLTYEESTLAVR